MDPVTLVCGAVMLVGLVGIVLPMLPGLLLVAGAAAVWGIEHGGPGGYTLVGIVLALYLAGLLTQYLIPGRRMRAAGVPTRTLLVGLAVGIVGMFVIPVAGLFVGFPLGIYLMENARLRDNRLAWGATKHALRAVGLNILIELATAVFIIGAWAISVWAL